MTTAQPFPEDVARTAANAALQAGLSVAGAVVAALAVGLISSGTLDVRLAVAGIAGVLLTLLFSGNARLSCLYGLVLTAPLEISKNFMLIAHQGGALSFRIDLVDIFLVTLLAMQLHDLQVGRRSVRNLRLPRVCVPWIVLMLLGSIFVVLGPYRPLTAMEIARMLKCLLLFLVLVNELVRVKLIGHVVLALMMSVMFQVSLGLLQYFLQRRLGLQVIGEASEQSIRSASMGTLATGEAVNRVGGLLGHSNVLAAFLALLLPIGVAMLFTRVDLRFRGLCLLVVMGGVIALVVTLSRTGWTGFGIATLGVLVLGNMNRRSRGRYALARMLIVAAIAVLLLAFSRQILLRLFHSDPNSGRARLEWVDVAWNMVKAKPVFGHGLNLYVFEMAPYSKYVDVRGLHHKYGKLLPVVHNNYLVVWAEQGTLGLMAFLALQYHILRLGIRNLRVGHETLFAVNVGCLCGLVAMMIDWITSFSLRIDTTTRMYWVVVAILCAIDYWRRANDAPSEAQPAQLVTA